jgi:hypothetical protein
MSIATRRFPKALACASVGGPNCNEAIVKEDRPAYMKFRVNTRSCNQARRLVVFFVLPSPRRSFVRWLRAKRALSSADSGEYGKGSKSRVRSAPLQIGTAPSLQAIRARRPKLEGTASTALSKAKPKLLLSPCNFSRKSVCNSNLQVVLLGTNPSSSVMLLVPTELSLPPGARSSTLLSVSATLMLGLGQPPSEPMSKFGSSFVLAFATGSPPPTSSETTVFPCLCLGTCLVLSLERLPRSVSTPRPLASYPPQMSLSWDGANRRGVCELSWEPRLPAPLEPQLELEWRLVLSELPLASLHSSCDSSPSSRQPLQPTPREAELPADSRHERGSETTLDVPMCGSGSKYVRGFSDLSFSWRPLVSTSRDPPELLLSVRPRCTVRPLLRGGVPTASKFRCCCWSSWIPRS